MTSHTMLILRSIVFTTGQTIATVFIATLGMLLFAFPYRIRYYVITRWSHFVIWWAKTICGIHYIVKGQENLPAKNAIVLCKHQSAWETLFLQVLLPPQCWVLKRELLWIPFFGWALSLLEPIAIHREKANSALKQLLEQGKQRLQQGRWVIIFPEGTRVSVGKTGKYSRSGALLAKESGYLAVPIAHNAGVFWPKNAFVKKPGTIELVIGPPIDPTQYSTEEIQQKAQEWIESTVAALPR
ncbi:MAG: lysophospholipid acyltransferase family protein [Candidatus Berkiellales bacterium]